MPKAPRASKIPSPARRAPKRQRGGRAPAPVGPGMRVGNPATQKKPSRATKASSDQGTSTGSSRSGGRSGGARWRRAFESEFSQLSKAKSVADCLLAALSGDVSHVHGPYYPEVAEVIGDLLKESLQNLDSLLFDDD